VTISDDGAPAAGATCDRRPRRTAVPTVAVVMACIAATAFALCGARSPTTLPVALRHGPQSHRGTGGPPIGLASASIDASERSLWPVRHRAPLDGPGGAIRGTPKSSGHALRVAQGTLAVSLAAVGRGHRVARTVPALPSGAAGQVDDSNARHQLLRDPSSRGGSKLIPAEASETVGALAALSPAAVAAGEGTARVVVSPDGTSVYAANRGTTTVSQYSRDTETGKLTPLLPATVAVETSPEGIVVSPDGKNAYVANNTSSGTLSQFARNPATGALTPLSPATVEAGTGPIGLTISPDGRDVYAANSSSATVSEYARNAETGKLTPLSPATVAAGANAHGILVSPDGKDVYATDYGAGAVSEYARNAETGKLTPLSPATVAAGINPHDLAISHDGESVYVANSTSPGTVSQFTRDATTGALTAMSTATVAAGEYTECVVVSPDGADVYATNEVTNNISQYSRDTETGALTAQSTATIATEAEPEGIAISAGGESIYAANHGSASVSQFARIARPTVVTGSATQVGHSSATLAGLVNPNGQATTYHFEYGTTALYQAQAPAPPDPSAGSGGRVLAVSANLTGLVANATYHYRIVATNRGGTSYGSDQTFTTPSDAALPVATPVPQGPGGQATSLPREASSQARQAPSAPDARLESTSLSVSPSGLVSVKVVCPTGESSCTGRLMLHTLGAVRASESSHRSKKGKAAVLTLAVGSFTVAGGHAKAVMLHLSARARTLLARTRVLRVRATIVARDPAGVRRTTQTTATLRARKPLRSRSKG
jgi:6-phosphogluconolactonase (cycloisomerase 2 family)